MNAASIETCLVTASKKLTSVSDRPRLEAEMLLSFVLQKPRSYFYARPETALDAVLLQQFDACLARRLNKEPIAYITGTRAFWAFDYIVSPHTLVPRPETELLVQAALDCFPGPASQVRVADLGTGSGAIILALATERPEWDLHATDDCEKALQVAMQNALRHQFTQVTFHQGDWCKALPELPFDMIVSNPPYIAECEWPTYQALLQYEPRRALVSGEDGLQAIHTILGSAYAYLKPGGYLLIEHGFSQGAATRALFAANHYEEIHSLKDFTGHERVTIGRLA